MIEFSGKRIALIGGAGFIGHNLALRLKALGAEVLVVDSFQANNLLAFVPYNRDRMQALYYSILNQRLELLNSAGIRIKVEDARDYHRVGLAISEFHPQSIVHLAAIAHANKSNKDPHSTFDHSFRTLENALDCARGIDVEHFVYFSSSMVYGDFLDGVVTEDTPCNPRGIYGSLKFAGEKLVIAYHQVFDMPYTIIRPSALYGERCVSRRVGQAFIENALMGNPLSINGDGNDKLDFTYIDDFVNGLLLVLHNKNSNNQIFNLTYGNSQSINSMVDIVREHFPDIEVHYNKRDKLMPERGTLSVDKARQLLGYDPQFPLEKGFVKYIKWYKDNFAYLENKRGDCTGQV